MLFSRMERFIDGKSPAAALFNGPYYLAEQLGFRKVIDTTFMIAAMIKGDGRIPEDVQPVLPRVAAGATGYRPAPRNSTRITTGTNFPDRFHADHGHAQLGPRQSASCSRPYSKEVFEQSFDWIAEHEIFAKGRMGSGEYDRSTISFAVE